MSAKPYSPIFTIVVAIAGMFMLGSCAQTTHTTELASKNYNQRIKSLIMHFTAVDYATSARLLIDEGGLSAHYLVPQSNDPSYPYKQLQVLQLVNESERAWHAGRSYWQGRESLNDSSIGIEIVNVPSCKDFSPSAQEQAGETTEANAYDDKMPAPIITENPPAPLCIFPDFDPQQIQLLITLSKEILARNPDISPTAVIGHSDIAPARKIDPGPRFPWYHLYKNGIGAWYDDDTIAKYWRSFEHYPASVGLLQRALNLYGYGITETGILDQASIDTIRVFQMHFLPWQVTGSPDPRTAAAIFALLEKYFPSRLDELLTRHQLETQHALTPPALLTKHGQIDRTFPEQAPSTRSQVNNKDSFKAYKGAGKLVLQSDHDASFDVYINQQKINIEATLQANKPYTYSLAKRSVNGLNSFRIDNIQPQHAKVKVHIPYPTLSNNTAAWKNAFGALDAQINQDIAQGFPGASLLVVHEGKIIKQSAYGYAKRFDEAANQLLSPQAMHEDTLFDLASNTKIYATTLALMKLVDMQRLDISRPIYDYLPEYQGDGREARVVADLLSHASGYASDIAFFNPDKALSPALYSQNKQATTRLLLQKVPFSHGKAMQDYSDINYMILGVLVERITGMSLDEFVEHEIYAPLGLANTLFTPLKKAKTPDQFAATELQGNTRAGAVDFPNIRRHVLQGEVHDEKAYYSMQGVAGHAGLFSNTHDLAILSQLLLNGGGYGDISLFNSSTLQRFIHPSGTRDDIGLGWRLAGQGERKWHFGPYASERAFGHTGWTGTVTVIDPEYDLAIILLTNKKHSAITQDGDNISFAGDDFETGKYGSIIALVYEAIIAAQAK